jgi:hypothetical protein
MTILARLSAGRILLHLLAMLGDRCVRFHLDGIVRELPTIASALRLFARLRGRAIAQLTLYLAQPLRHSIANQSSDRESLAALLHRGDVLLTQGNSRFAAMIKCFTRSPWSHVSMYVGPLDNGPDPLCVVEADIAAGVRSIRLSELNALQVRVLRPIGLTDTDRARLADWVVGQIGSEYDFAHAWGLLRYVLRLLLPDRFRSAPGTIACNRIVGAARDTHHAASFCDGDACGPETMDSGSPLGCVRTPFLSKSTSITNWPILRSRLAIFAS